jgi:Ca2+-binding RTX toxin-like protein
MAIFYGSDESDYMDAYEVSNTVTSHPSGLTATTTGGDTLFGYDGLDFLDGGGGNDVVHAGEGNDTIAELIDGNDQLFGEAGNDSISGGQGSDIVQGGSGADFLVGGYPGDRIGDDNDTILGGAGFDYLSGDNEAYPQAFGDDSLFGSAGEDAVFGGGGDDLLRGGSGADDLVGGEGGDTLIGGTGSDQFRFRESADSTPEQFDLIRGEFGGGPAFEGAGVADGDTISLASIDANELVAGDQGFLFGGRETGHLWLAENGTRTLVFGNMDSDAAPEFKLAVADGVTTAADYVADDFFL